MNSMRKQPGETLDYDFDYSDWMPSGDTISSAVITADSGITLGTKTINTATHKVKQVISGGTDGTTYLVTCRATTVAGLVKEKEFKLKVREIS